LIQTIGLKLAGRELRQARYRKESMFRRWRIVAFLLVCCLTSSLSYLFLMGRLLDVVVRVVEFVGRLGRK
jgi:hypothetical protein